MNKILIATTNRDKFVILRDLFLAINQAYEYVSLEYYGNIEEPIEKGDQIARSIQKATYYADNIHDPNVVAVIGVDDGIKIPKMNINTAFSKETTDKILSGSLVIEGEEIVISRGISLQVKGNKESHSCLVDIPFRFIGNPRKVARKANMYPLSFALAYLNATEAVSEHSREENTRYYLSFARGELTKLISHLKRNN